MSIPPFPSQDLAKLVLGYLAEEQLMTAYDEFLQASPYLDALRNEYDRIFMTSLKSILAEYRAVKIYVDTCKPYALRKKIFQCTNLLEVVKFLIANVDLKKIVHQDTTDKSRTPEQANIYINTHGKKKNKQTLYARWTDGYSIQCESSEKQNVTIPTKSNNCELCHSLSLPNCVCKHQTSEAQKPAANSTETISLQSSVDTTPLNDLPGNYVTTRKKHVRVLEKDSMLGNNVSSMQNSDASTKQSFSSHISPEEYLARCESSPVLKSSESNMSMNSTVKVADPVKSSQNIEEFNNVLKSVVNRNKTLSGSEGCTSQRISNAGTFQEFTSGMTSVPRHNAIYSVPDSSTSENVNIKVPIRKDVYNDNIKGPPPQLMLQLSHVKDAIEIQTSKTTQLTKLLPKTQEKQITIISDVKVDNNLNDKLKHGKTKTLVPINATSTPLMHMQTIMINGTPAYKHTPNTHVFTKDEIMAMPTLIVVPASGPSQIPSSANCNPVPAPKTNVISDKDASPRVLGPLVIDVPNTVNSILPTMSALPDLNEEKPVTADLVQTVDAKQSNGTTASVPKDNIISLESSNTPQVLPPLRKSSSTPRRTSHVRVLDFTTPRRILHETINEVPIQTSVLPVDIVVSASQSIVSTTTKSDTMSTKSEVAVNENVTNSSSSRDMSSAKENETANKTVVQAKKFDWDADLRALVANEKPVNIPHFKPKTRNMKKKKSTDKTPAIKEQETKKKTRKKSPRVKKNISRNVEDLEDEPPLIKTPDVPCCKPNIKIICGDKSTDLQESKSENSSTKNKSQEKTDEYIETPEAERLSLQNVIGAKLNISDFLETPYKQALYDIQMETPKFLGTDLPDLPLSNIKITDIPTPRFLNTPKPAQATPSSYSSRPTDYSSGGSYYKPDDQDYMPIPDLFTCPVTSSSIKENVSFENTEEKECDERKSRPTRKCAKNVSYYKNSGAVKVKDVEDNINAISSDSEPISVNSSFEFKSKQETTATKTPRAKSQTSKTESRKKTVSASKKRKSPKNSAVKDRTKSFMKIKPKYTPKKDTPARIRKQSVQTPCSKLSPNIQPRKRTTSKDKLVNSASIIIPAATKSRRKSSTPRKLHCTKSFSSESCSLDSPDNIAITKADVNIENSNAHESDTEQLALRWSDDGSQDSKTKDSPPKSVTNEPEDINKIQQFIVSTDASKSDRVNDGTLQQDLMKRGFDLETAKIIERDLLDDTPRHTEATKSRMVPIPVGIVESNTKKDESKSDSSLEKTVEISSCNTNELQIAEEESDEVEFSVHECNEESGNYFVFQYDDTNTKDIAPSPPVKLKDNYTMEICIEDMTLRLIATPFNLTIDQDPLTVEEIDYSYKETEDAVKSISGMDRLYTPLKDSYKSQCYEIFDSTLTSIDTPLKAKSPVKDEGNASITKLVLEEKVEAQDKAEAKNRKRARSSSNESANSSKRTKPDADLLLKAANIQNIDIETVLTKLHGH